MLAVNNIAKRWDPFRRTILCPTLYLTGCCKLKILNHKIYLELVEIHCMYLYSYRLFDAFSVSQKHIAKSRKWKYYCLHYACLRVWLQYGVSKWRHCRWDLKFHFLEFSEAKALQSPSLWKFFKLCLNFQIIEKWGKVIFKVLSSCTDLNEIQIQISSNYSLTVRFHQKTVIKVFLEVFWGRQKAII